MTLAFKDANSKLFDVISVAHVDDEERVDDSLVENLKLRFSLPEILNFGHDIESKVFSQDFQVYLVYFWSRL